MNTSNIIATSSRRKDMKIELILVFACATIDGPIEKRRMPASVRIKTTPHRQHGAAP